MMQTFFRHRIMYRRDRSSRGGGVTVVVKNTIWAFLTRQIDNHESVTLKCHVGSDLLSFLRCIVHPTRFLYFCVSYVNTWLHLLLEHIFWLGTLIYLVLAGISRFFKHEMSSHVAYLTDIMFTADVHQVFDQPTRIQGNCASTLNLIFISHCINNCFVSVQPGLSDHKMVFISFIFLERAKPSLLL